MHFFYTNHIYHHCRLARGVFALTAKREFVIECRLTSLQQDLYIALLSKYGVPTKPRSMPFSNMISVRDTNAAISAHNLLGKCHELLLVVNHPQIFRQVHDKRLSKPAVFPNSSSSQPIITIDDDSDDTEPESNKIPQPRCERTLEPVNLMNDIMTGVTTRLDSEASDDNQARPPAAQVTATTVNEERLSSEKTIQKILVAARGMLKRETRFASESHIASLDIASIEHSVKIQVALAIITKARRIGDKVLLFSRSIPTLDYLERCLDSITGENAIKFVRLDGDVASVVCLPRGFQSSWHRHEGPSSLHSGDRN